jgi:hypothetical protein
MPARASQVLGRKRAEGIHLLGGELALRKDRVRGLRVLRSAVTLDFEGPLVDAVLVAHANEVLEEHHPLLEDLRLARLVERNVQGNAQRGLESLRACRVVVGGVLAVDEADFPRERRTEEDDNRLVAVVLEA